MNEKILVLGDGGFARNLSRSLAAAGIAPVSARDLTWCDGEIGAFQVKGQSEGAPFEETVHGIVLAHDSLPVPSLDATGLSDGPEVVALSRAASDPNRFAAGKTVAFFAGATRETDPVTMGSVMELALVLQTEKKARVFIFTGNLKVAGDGLERLFRQTKTAGVFWAKFTKNPPMVGRDEAGNPSITFEDEITRQPFSLCPDVIVAADDWPAPPALLAAASLLKLHSGADDRPQTDNVRRAVVRTNRAGVWVAGGARRRQFASDDVADADNAVLDIREALDNAGAPALAKAQIKQGFCVRCLTCFRVCPHGAVTIKDDRVHVLEQACQRCGMCMAECPRGAIAVPDLLETAPVQAGESRDPAITLFCCQRSAGKALDAAKSMGGLVPDNLTVVNLPCAGGLSMTSVMDAFAKGADGVMVLTCHPGNCNSETGAPMAKQRLFELKDRLCALGLAPDRFSVHSLAANMDRGCLDLIHDFRAALLGDIAK